MFRCIKGSSSIDPFKRTTDTSYYDMFLNDTDLAYMEKAKNRTGRIEMMSPNEYYRACATIFNSSVSDLMSQRTNKYSGEYSQNMLDGDKFPLCYINYAEGGQEGLHRMKAAGDAFGWDTKFPVLCVYAYDNKKEEAAKQRRAMRDFERHDLEKCCDIAAENIADPDQPAPADIEEIFEQEVERVAKQEYNCSIVVRVSTYENEEGYHRLNCELLKYNEIDNDYPENESSCWIEDMFMQM